jgi:hypothetical protein
MSAGLLAHGVSPATANHAAHIPPISVLFAAFLGYNPIQHLLGSHVLATLSPNNQAVLTGQSFFPHLIAGPFRTGLHATFIFAIVACLVAAGASLLRSERRRGLEPSGVAADDRRQLPRLAPAARSQEVV